MRQPARIAVFASGGGTNLQSLVDRFHGEPGAPARVELLIASRPGIGAIARAERGGIAARVLSGGAFQTDELAGRMLAALEEHGIDLVVLAGYLQLVPTVVVERYRGRMINIHPGLLPGFGGPGMYGMRVHRAVLEAGARVTGATVHLVDERYDEGAILAQWPVPVLSGDTPESLAARVLRVEHLLLPAVVQRLAGGWGAAPVADPAAFELVARSAPEPGSVATYVDLP